MVVSAVKMPDWILHTRLENYESGGFMKNKLIIFVLFLFEIAFSNSVSFWNDSTSYNRGDTVIFNNVRYVATVDGINTRAFIEEGENSFGTVPGDNDLLHWHRIVPLEIQTGPGLRMGPVGHRRLKDFFVNYDRFVIGVASKYNFDLNIIECVGINREKTYPGKVGDMHSGWSNFMVDGWCTETIRNLINQGHNGDSLMRAVTVKRKYNNYRNWSKDNGTLNGRAGAFEQIMHNIGDAGVAFAHALGGYLELDGWADLRELANEYAAKKALNDNNWENMSYPYFTGSIYDAIREYGLRTRRALDWARERIKKEGRCRAGHKAWILLGVYPSCYTKYSDDFDKLVKSQEYGVMRFAIAVGRFILIDAILTERPLEHQRIRGEPFLRSDANHRHTFTAFARDPDAVLISNINNPDRRLTSNSKLLLDFPNRGYQLWHEPSVHDMSYYWDIRGNGYFNDFSDTNNGNITFTVVSASDWNAIKAGGDGSVVLRIEGRDGNIPINIKEGGFNISVKIKDDEGDSAIVIKPLTFRSSIPIANVNIKKGNRVTERPYIAKVRHKNTSVIDGRWHEHNGIRVLSGFSDISCYDNLYLDFFSESVDSSGTSSDIIAATKLKTEDFNWHIKGVNQDTTVNGENRIIINNTFWLETAGSNEVKAKLRQYFVSSIWENDSSPKIASELCKTFDSLGNYQIVAEILNRQGRTSLKKTLDIPVLAPPSIKSVRMLIRHDTDANKAIIETYSGTPLVLGRRGRGEDVVLEFEAEAFDSERENNLLENSSYVWAILEKDETLTDAAFERRDFSGRNLKRTYTELIGQLGLEDSKTYELFLKVRNDFEGFACGNYGFTITKVGEFRLDQNKNY